MNDDALAKGIAEFNRGDFYACHDTLEAIWMQAPPGEKNFYQGILQIAVGFYHLQNGNQRGAAILLGEGIRRLGAFLPHHRGLALTPLVEASYRLLETLQTAPSFPLESFCPPQIFWLEE
ncbi:MAG: DUF309 domain-containing protein [Cyanobacteriota bacterium]|jgi:predicted metal-dependent hydrolase